MKKQPFGPSQRNKKRLHIPSFVTLAWWQVRPTWRLLSIIAIAIILAVAFVCTVPLYSDVTMTAGLRTALTSPTQNSDITISSFSEQLNTRAINKNIQSLNTVLRKDIGAFINPARLSIQSSQYNLMVPDKNQHGKYTGTADVISFISEPENSMAPHLTLLHGRLPRSSTSAIEVVLTAESANQLHIHVGSTLAVPIAFGPLYTSHYQNQSSIVVQVPILVVGIINPTSVNDPYWHSTTFLSTFSAVSPGFIYTGLTSTEAYLNYFSHLLSTTITHRYSGYTLFQPYTVIVYYSFNAPAISIYDLNQIINDLSHLQMDIKFSENLNNPPFIEQLTPTLPGDILQRFSARMAVVVIPTGSLLVVVVGLLLFFVSLINNIVIERQSETIALLRSRGASRKQIFGVFATQSVVLGIIALLLGPMLAIALVRFIALFTLAPADRAAVNILSTKLPVIAMRLIWYPLLAVLIAVCTSAVTIGQRISSNILTLRRETARTTGQTFLQRLRLDAVAIVIAVVAFVFLQYLLNEGIVNTALNLLLIAPLTVLSIFFLVLAATLLFLRLFPLLLRFGASLTMKRRGAAPMIALAQMARTPHQSVRTTLLLTLATACLLFLFIFNASQSQRIADVSAYQTGADISGIIRTNGLSAIDRPRITDQYRQLSGVVSASVGYITTAAASTGATSQLPMQINAVDSSTFAQTALWPQQNSAHPLSTLMQQFIAQRKAAISSNVIPAVVDDAMWQALQLSPNAHFSLLFNNGDVINGTVNFVAIARVSHIPTITDSTVASDTTEVITHGGMMIDYETFAQVYSEDFSIDGVSAPLNYVWLKTTSNPAILQHMRSILLPNTDKSCCVQLLQMYDRRAISASLQNDPLYLDIIGLLGMGTIITIVLLLLGNVIASWLNVRNRLAQFVVLHALGATSRQVSNILLWEQSISYLTGIILGLLFGLLLAIFLLPSLVYTGIVSIGVGSDLSTAQFYLIQNAPPIQIVLPSWLPLLLIILLLIFTATLLLVVRIITRPSPSRTLRLNVD